MPTHRHGYAAPKGHHPDCRGDFAHDGPCKPVTSGAIEPLAKGDGETWEAYARRLEKRVKAQRDHIKSLTELRDVPGDKKARTRIAILERLLGKKEVQLANQYDGLHAQKAEIESITQAAVGLLDDLDEAIAGADLETWDAPYRIEATVFRESSDRLREVLWPNGRFTDGGF